MQELSDNEQTARRDLYEVDVPETRAVEDDEAEVQNYLEDLQRLQADFSNYRRRMMAEVDRAQTSGARRLVEQLLPVLDNFDLAVGHGEGGSGVAMVRKQLMDVLEQAGLTEVPSEGEPFDPNVHEAVEIHEDETVGEEMVVQVHRRGYRFRDVLLRAAMVVVARPQAGPETPHDREPAGRVDAEE